MQDNPIVDIEIRPLTDGALIKMLGSNRVTELFSGKRDLSMAQVRILHQYLHIPTDLLIFSKRPVRTGAQ